MSTGRLLGDRNLVVNMDVGGMRCIVALRVRAVKVGVLWFGCEMTTVSICVFVIAGLRRRGRRAPATTFPGIMFPMFVRIRHLRRLWTETQVFCRRTCGEREARCVCKPLFSRVEIGGRNAIRMYRSCSKNEGRRRT